MTSAMRVCAILSCTAPAEEERWPERTECIGLNAYLLSFVSEISLINLTKQDALAQAAANPTAARPERRYVALGRSRLTFRIRPADEPGVSALPVDALLFPSRSNSILIHAAGSSTPFYANRSRDNTKAGNATAEA